VARLADIELWEDVNSIGGSQISNSFAAQNQYFESFHSPFDFAVIDFVYLNLVCSAIPLTSHFYLSPESFCNPVLFDALFLGGLSALSNSFFLCLHNFLLNPLTPSLSIHHFLASKSNFEWREIKKEESYFFYLFSKILTICHL
jgi:hypothetical protein